MTAKVNEIYAEHEQELKKIIDYAKQQTKEKIDEVFPECEEKYFIFGTNDRYIELFIKIYIEKYVIGIVKDFNRILKKVNEKLPGHLFKNVVMLKLQNRTVMPVTADDCPALADTEKPTNSQAAAEALYAAHYSDIYEYIKNSICSRIKEFPRNINKDYLIEVFGHDCAVAAIQYSNLSPVDAVRQNIDKEIENQIKVAKFIN